LVSYTKERTKIESVSEQGAKENIWTCEGGECGGWMERIT